MHLFNGHLSVIVARDKPCCDGAASGSLDTPAAEPLDTPAAEPITLTVTAKGLKKAVLTIE